MADLGLILITIIVTLSTPFATALAPISNEGCESKCGSVSIPFPFGMGNSDCFLDKGFEVTCNNSVTPPRPLLKFIQLEVINISVNKDDLYNEVLVKGPISFFNCTDRNKTSPERVSLTGSPFSFSQKNVFVARSCGVRANLDSRSGNAFTQIGCTPNCNRNNRSVSNYCQTSVPSNLDSFQIGFESDTTGGRECRYAFVASSEYWYGNTTQSSSFSGVSDQGYVPVILDWQLEYRSYYDLFKEDLTSEFPYCNVSGSPSSVKRVIKCYCPYGFRGNPYLSVGCTEDINECEEFTEGLMGWCAPGSTCVNTYGDYNCSFKRVFLVIGFGSAIGALLLLFGLWGSLYKSIKKRKETQRRREFFKKNGGLNLRQKLLSPNEGNIEKTRLFTLDELEKATDHFSIDRILGQGGQGTVYKGMLEDGKIVAVKKSKAFDKSKPSGFINEVLILSQINHRNVVQLLGCCLETEVPILVYEFIPNKTLYHYIHEENPEFRLTWRTRVRIASEVAGALSYLHSSAAIPIFHRDIKSTNILLDEKYKAKVADFGLSRTISLEQTHLSTLVAGTFGYLDPEYFQTSQFTEKSDVFSFGVVLAEILTGQKAICSIREDEGTNLATYFSTSMEANGLFDILDPQVIEDGPKEEIEMMARLALSCLSLSGRNRPTMKEVAMELEAIKKNELRSETHYSARQNQNNKEIEFTDFVVPWDVASGSTESAVNSSVFQQELPLLSMESR